MELIWHTKSYKEIIQELSSRESGLNNSEVQKRLKEYGSNELPDPKVDSFFSIFLKQFQSPLIYILFLASLIIFLMGELTDGFIILFVLFFNALIGTIQEGKAQNTLLLLKEFSETNTLILREEKEIIISSKEIVPGDIIILQDGNKIPADARIIDSHYLILDQSTLTGESVPVHKVNLKSLNKKLSPADQNNMVFKGTHIVAGNGKAIVVATGLNTILGKISKKIETINTEIPLKRNIENIAKIIITLVGIISLLLFIIGIWSGNNIREMFKIVVSLSVSVIPEGLPIVITLILTRGVFKMSKQNVLVKRLQAVESLGEAEIIAVDKTGTITKNEMIIQKIYTNNKLFEVGGIGYEPKGKISFNGKIINPRNYPELMMMGKLALFCANARVFYSEEKDQWLVSGEPTEASLLVLGHKIGFNKSKLEEKYPLIIDIPFSHANKYHGTTHLIDNKGLLKIVGAPETVLSLCYKLSLEEKKIIESMIRKMSKQGLRVLAVGINENVSFEYKEADTKKLTFIGLFGMKDGLRPEVIEAVKKTKLAGVKVIMITGDHKITAQAVAREAGIFIEGDSILTGKDIDELSDEEFKFELEKTTVFARVSPEHKLKIIKAYKDNGKIIAMTGDGVNDAPSLVAADLGVAMGKIGTEVAKEASDLVLLDDNFGSIVDAIKEGRNIYKNIKRVILYLFSTGIGEIMVITVAIILKLPLPLLAAQIIWLNLVTDSFPILAMSFDSKGGQSFYHEKFSHRKKIIDSLMIQRMIIMATPMVIGTLILFKYYLQIDSIKALTVSLTVLAAFQWLNAWNCISKTQSLFKEKILQHKFLIGATLLVIGLQLLAVYTPFFQKILHTTPLSFIDWLLIIVVGFSVVIFEEIRKWLYQIFD
ncbi:hypothetical protein A2995_00705 [Candidatus Nomurabacteria bacterium RIFCSPLOWO2_01_FULL_33_24]|uniref:Cation-transporting P-type ATPase N-terminal domain-containing protein n=1 Tax=Candidatus Nomurabacteria bacterium RIFCSPLOWO2_01_FULL_33_24 TaxID=1801765 RepID=A0A1F6X114_9BACT|nr:MAG: hypothetical protein A2995_00705 [Candidatus Nomurabacteria bacterium RIFCSPLOWO2_01_FULL_33_24]